MRRIWIDVEDIFTFVQSGGRRPSGIQRVVGEICQALRREFGETGQVNFVRHDSADGLLRIVPWPILSNVFEVMANAPYDPPGPPMKERLTASKSPVYLGFRRLVSRLPPRARFAIMRFGRAELDALSALTDLFRREQDTVSRRLERESAGVAQSHRATFAASVSAGDVVLMLGAPWLHPGYGERVSRLRRGCGVSFALLVHDIIPLRRPEWVPRDSSHWFHTRFGPLLGECDYIFATSQASAGDVEHFAREIGLNIPLPVRALPFGTGFSCGATAEPVRADVLPEGDYVLFVSTVEVRKNHALLLRVWRRLLEELPYEHVPTLVFAGRSDPSVVDVMRQLVNSDYLGGKIRHVEAPSDAELAALYRGCLFTVFPSFYEGWGLPVSESLSFGKPCIVSSATSLPEAGGSLARYFDPDDGTEAYRLIRETITDRAGLRRWHERVCREFRPVPWRQTAGALMEALQITSPAEA
jgi:glycosyltransferase involved in cell wall biosynthesis